MRGKHWELKKRKGSSDWQVVFYLPGGGGKKTRKLTGTSDEGKAALRAGEIWVEEMRKAQCPIPEAAAAAARATVETVVAEFMLDLEKRAGQHAAGYVERYERDLKLYVMPKTADEVRNGYWQPSWTYLDEITTASWEEEKLRLHNSNGGPLGSRSIQVLTNTLRHLLRFAVPRFIDNAPELIAPPRARVLAEQRKKRAMTPAEREEYLRAVAAFNPHDRRSPSKRLLALPPGTAFRFYEALFFTLFRRGEMWEITQRWLDLDGGNIHIPPEHAKNGREESIPLHPRAARALLDQVKAAGITSMDAPIFGTIDVRAAHRFAMKKTGIDPWGITAHHTTRHTGGTILAKATNDREALKAAGRWHSDQSVDAYIHIDAEHARPLFGKL